MKESVLSILGIPEEKVVSFTVTKVETEAEGAQRLRRVLVDTKYLVDFEVKASVEDEGQYVDTSDYEQVLTDELPASLEEQEGLGAFQVAEFAAVQQVVEENAELLLGLGLPVVIGIGAAIVVVVVTIVVVAVVLSKKSAVKFAVEDRGNTSHQPVRPPSSKVLGFVVEDSTHTQGPPKTSSQTYSSDTYSQGSRSRKKALML